MRRFIALTLVSLISVGMFTACSDSNSQPSEDPANNTMQNTVQNTDTAAENNTTSDGTASDNTEVGGKTLIAYFSRVGNTDFDSNVDAVTSASLNKSGGNMTGNAQILAGFAQEVTNGDVFLIETENKYPSEYRETTDVAKKELNEKARPTLASSVENFENYDNIVLIYPNWWGTIPMPVAVFLESYDFSGKTVFPICTHEGSAMGSSERDIKEILHNANVVTGLAVKGGSVTNSKSDVESYLTSQ